MSFSESTPAYSSTATEACHGPRIVVAPGLAERWRDAQEDARVRLSGKVNLDRCASVLLDPDADNLSILVSLPDGRTTVRHITDPAQLFPTLNALLSLPPMALGAPAPQTTAPVGPEPEPRGRLSRATGPSPHLEVGMGGMARVAGAPLYGGAGFAAFGQLTLQRWIIGVSARWDAVDGLLNDAPPSGFNMQTLSLGIDFGVRSSFPSVLVDALVGPQVRIENQEAFGGEAALDGVGGGTSDVRLDASLRLLSPPGRALRFFAEGDVDASPGRLRRARRLDAALPVLPAWSAGLALGLSWSLP